MIVKCEQFGRQQQPGRSAVHELARAPIEIPTGTSADRRIHAMPRKQSQPTPDADKAKRYQFHFDDKQYRLTYEQAFSFGHTLMQGGHFETAAQIFAKLAKVPDRGPRAKIMLSRCAVGMDKYAVCQEILKIAFKGEDHAVIEMLQAAFVYHKLGMQTDAIREMTKVIQKYKNVPTACLLLGDMFAAEGMPRKATYCWNLAIERDRPGGGVALSARKQLDALKTPRHNREQRDQAT